MDKPNSGAPILLGGVPEGYDGFVLADLARSSDAGVLFIARDDRRMAAAADALAFFGDDLETITIPAWDCLPYDRVSPKGDILARRVDSLTQLASSPDTKKRVILTTIASVLQKVPGPEMFEGRRLDVSMGGGTGRGAITAYLVNNNFQRTETVMEPGEYAVRGGILDVFPPSLDTPLRLDFFGDELESIRIFDPVSQLTSASIDGFQLDPVGEIDLDEDAISRFRTGYRALFGAASDDDILYASISEGRRFPGMEHWLPLFHEKLVTLLDYTPGCSIVLDHQFEDASRARWELTEDCFRARGAKVARGTAFNDMPYHALPVDRLYIGESEWAKISAGRSALILQPFAAPGHQGAIQDAGGKPGRDFADVRARPGENVFDALRSHIEGAVADGQMVILAAVSEGSRDRLLKVLVEHNVSAAATSDPWAQLKADSQVKLWARVLDIPRGFAAPGLTVISEQDILGDRVRRTGARRLRADNFIAETTSLMAGDLVVHEEHGIGRFIELVTLDVAGQRHDCLKIEYDRSDKLFVPVENIDVLSRYGDEESEIRLDHLGGAQWQARKARMKERIREMAGQLIVVAAARELSEGDQFIPDGAAYDEFCTAFPFEETEDQNRAIDDVLADLAKGRPMDRLICGDVGFGKTEVALRAAFT
ncbi:MAG: transcription-repair coupling factor, partial [Rhodospirillales bacterium]|nr:transcription-repair coupling factor [Rhodospirillales bacterium]